MEWGLGGGSGVGTRWFLTGWLIICCFCLLIIQSFESVPDGQFSGQFVHIACVNKADDKTDNRH